MTESNGDTISKHNDNIVVYFMFGRFQPPTKAHVKMIFNMSNMSEKNSDVYVFVSSTQNANKNPLNVSDKIIWLKKSYGEANKIEKNEKEVRFINTTKCLKGFNSVAKIQECKNIFKIIDVLKSAGYTTLNLCVGSDRYDDFNNLLNKYKHEGLTINVIPFEGKRNNSKNNSNISGISGTKMREAAMSNNFEKFKKGTNLSNTEARELMKLVRNKITEHKNLNTRKRKRVNKIQTKKAPK